MSHTDSILIVDDDPRFCDSLKVLLSNQGYQIQTSNSGKEAVEYLANNSYDLVLLDVVIPDMDGHQIMDFINSKSPETLVIVITGHASTESAIESLRRGAYDYLRKPFEPEELLKTVENTLNRKRLEKEKKTIQTKLTLTEERYQYLVDNSPDIIYILDHEGRFAFVNDAIEPLLGFEANQLIGNHYTSIVFEEDIDKARYNFNERRTGKRAAVSTELRLKFYHNGDEPKPSERQHLAVELKAMGMYDRPADSKDKKFTGTYGVGRDISARRQAEEALKRSEAQKKAILDASIDRISLVDKDLRIIWANKTTTRELNMAPENLVGHTCYKVLLGRDTPCVGCPAVKALKSGQTEHVVMHQAKSKTTKGEAYWDDYAVPIKNESGDIVNIIEITRNITERVQAEEALRRERDKLQGALDKVKTLSGMLPICSNCKKIRDDKGYWNQIESYIANHSEVDFSHSICPECAKKLYPEFYKCD